ncbi:MAG: META domain-containing protein [Arenibacterium sp.]
MCGLATLGLMAAFAPIATATPTARIFDHQTLLEESQMSVLEGNWTVVEMAYGDIPEDAEVTIDFTPGWMRGIAACNPYRAEVSFDGAMFNQGEIYLPGRECSIELEEAEEKFIAALELCDNYRLEENGDLALLAQSNVMIRAVPRIDPQEG